MDRKTFWCDFDQTLCRSHNETGEFGPPIDKGIQVLRWMKARGARVVVLTARKDLSQVRQWLEDHDIKVDDVTNTKPSAALGLDDRVVHFDDSRSVASLVGEALEILKEPKRRSRRFAGAA